jgi:hypothetical protein
MNRESVKKNMDIISAFAEGKVIQVLNERDNWVDLTEREGLPMGTLEDAPDMFRIKPEPKCRPFKDAEECWNEMRKHYPFGWVKLKATGKYFIQKAVGDFLAVVGIDDRPTSYDKLFEEYTFADGVSFGVKVEE